MTQNKYNLCWTKYNFFSVKVDSRLQTLLDEGIALANAYPEIIESVRADQDKKALADKAKRVADKKYHATNRTDVIAGFENAVEAHEAVEKKLTLNNTGAPRMSPLLAFLFMLTRGYFGSATNADATERIKESSTIQLLYSALNVAPPGRTTILENLNNISEKTYKIIFDSQMMQVLYEDLDDFSKCVFDSTSIAASTCWPTDSGLMLRLSQRIFHASQRLDKLELPNFRMGRCKNWIKDMNSFNFQINCLAGKPHSKQKIEGLYKKFLRRAQKIHDHFIKEMTKLEQAKNNIEAAPSVIAKIERAVEMIDNDICGLHHVIYYSEARIFAGVKLKSTEKIISISDVAAAYIKKGGREDVVGYKPQIALSGNGFITSAMIPEGNAADSEMFVPVVEDIVKRTYTIPKIVTVDDGYSSEKGRNALLKMGIEIVSIGGAKGKRLTPEETWNSDAYKEARNWRSAGESIMFVLKYTYKCRRFTRRGIEAVRAELLEKVIVYNFFKMASVRKEKAEKAA